MYSLRTPVARVSSAQALPAPTGGVNDLDPLASMDASFVIDSMNWYMDTGLMTVRPGYKLWADGMVNPIETIMSYDGVDGGHRVFAATNLHIFEVTASTALPPIVDNVTNGYFSYTNFATEGGHYLIAANGADPMVYFDGTTWNSFVVADPPDAPGEIKGLDPATINFVFAHKNRLWFLQNNSMTAWYFPLDSIGGEAKPFFLGSVFRRGGRLIAMARWSSDTGEGLDDRLVFISSQGEIASYSGTDPNEATSWSLDSIFFVASPLSRRSVTDYGGDVLFLCRRGLVPLSTLTTGEVTTVLYSSALTKRISRTLIQLTNAPDPLFQPEVLQHNDSAWTIINLYDKLQVTTSPYDRILTDGSNAPLQLVMNILTGAWGKFNYPARTFCSVGRDLYFGTEDGKVMLVTPNGFTDGAEMDGGGGQPIPAYAMSAYTYLNNPTANKHAKFVRPTFQTEVKPAFRMRVLPDFRLDKYQVVPPPNPAVANARWDVSEWDAANWAGLENVYRPWVSANVLGYAFAWQMNVSTSAPLGLSSVEWIWEAGGLV